MAGAQKAKQAFDGVPSAGFTFAGSNVFDDIFSGGSATNSATQFFGGAVLTPIGLGGSILVAIDELIDSEDSPGAQTEVVLAWQSTPGAAAFGGASTQLPFSVDSFGGAYALTAMGLGSAGAYNTFSFVTQDFWVDFSQSGQPTTLPQIRPAFGLEQPTPAGGPRAP